MKSLRSHFVFNRSERNGIFILVLIIIILQGVYFFLDTSSAPAFSEEQQEEIRQFQAQIDSVKQLAKAGDSLRMYPFNPNFISDYKGYILGMSVEEIDRLHGFRSQDQWVNSREEFQEVTGVSDSLLDIISPYFKFPVRPASYKENASRKKLSTKVPVRDLNEASAEDLMQVYGVGEVLSKRIVKYRESIGGFRDVEQLKQVYGLESEVVVRISESFRILNTAGMEKQDLNSISVLELSAIPGFNYELARAVVEYREERKKFESFEELGKIKGFPLEKIEGIQLYLTIR